MIATPPTTGPLLRPRNPIAYVLSRIGFGVSILTAILIYASILSALPQVRGAIEVTEMQAFRHWLFVALIAIFCLSLAVATWTRIKWNLINAGVLTVHSGLLILAGGAVWYFSTKVEGDVLLLAPKVELIGPSGPIQTAELPAEKGRRWTRFMPAFGGAVSMEVIDTQGAGLTPVRRATVRVKAGDGEPQDAVLTEDRPQFPISNRLAVRLVTYPPQTKFYDDESPALYCRRADDSEPRIVEIPNLPIHRERYLDAGYVLRDRSNREVRSRRWWPHIRLGGLTIPTGWFERWRLPIRLDAPDLPFDIEVTGYVPYIARMEARAAGGGDRLNPAIEITLSDGRTSLTESLFAFDPAQSLWALPAPFEFRWVADEQERERLLTPLVGPHELTIEIADPPVQKTLAVTPGATIRMEGTPYELTVREFSPSWPLMSPGFENASSPMASLDVSNGQTRFNRTVIQRFPQLSQDIDEQGVRRRDGPVDGNIVLRYRTSAEGWVLITAGPGLPAIAGVFTPDGRVQRVPLEVGRTQPLRAGQMALTCALRGVYENARSLQVPVIEPLETRQTSLEPRSASAIRLDLRGRGPYTGWSQSLWVPFSRYPHTDQQPVLVRLPDDSQWELIYSRYPRDLGATIGAGRLTVDHFPGRMSVERWRSDFLVQRPGDKDRPEAGPPPPVAGAVSTNHTYAVGPWTLYQSGAARDDWSFTILGVGNRRGIWPMLTGCVLVTLGSLYAFYVKPVLRRRRQAQALAEADAAGRLKRPVRREARELVEAGR